MTLRLFALFLACGTFGLAQAAAPATAPAPAQSAPGQSSGSANAPGVSLPNLAPQSEAKSAAQNQNQNAQKNNAPETAAAVQGPEGTTVPSEFQVFAQDAAGHPLPIYGWRLFSEVPTTFAPMDRVPVPSNYVLGPGDQLLIRVWGAIDFENTVTVDRDGQIFLPKVGAIRIAGLRYDQVESFIRTAIAGMYKGFELNVSMGQLRSIQIFVLGSAQRPGVYTVSSLSTLINALFASGGPSGTGSMRNIELRRDGQVVTTFDVYDLLRNGDKSKDSKLLPGDVIYIPPVGPQVAIWGSVKDPGIYELKGETSIAAGLKETGGLTTLAEKDRVLLERIEEHRRRRVDEFSLDRAGLARVLRDGDMLEVFPISPRFENAITIRGNVAQPGRFPWHEGMRVSDLIPTREYLITSAYWNRKNQQAGNGRVEMMDDLSRSSTDINWEYASIERLDEHDLTTRVISLNLGNAIADPSSPDNEVLQPGDVLTVFSSRDIPLPREKQSTYVRVSGEVKAPGVYRVKPGDTLRDLVARAGGLTRNSYLYASQLTRVSTQIEQDEQMRLSLDQMRRDLMARYSSSMKLVPGNGGSGEQTEFNQQLALISELGTLHPTGRIVLQIKSNASQIGDVPDFPLENGDSFYVPPRLGTVQVAGAVYNPNAFRYQARKHLVSYLHDAGGPVRTADRKRAFLIRADGTVVSRQSYGSVWHDSFESLAVFPGDAIIVPSKLKIPGAFGTQLPYIASLLYQAAATSALLKLYY